MYYWTVKHDDSDAQDIISYREEFGTLRQHHIIIESLSPLLKNSASFALGHRIYTDKTWRDLNDTLVIYLQSQSVQDDKEKPALGINIGAATLSIECLGGSPVRTYFSRDDHGVQEPSSTEFEGNVLQIPRGDILGPHSYTIFLRAVDPRALLESSSHPGRPNMSVANTYNSYITV